MAATWVILALEAASIALTGRESSSRWVSLRGVPLPSYSSPASGSGPMCRLTLSRMRTAPVECTWNSVRTSCRVLSQGWMTNGIFAGSKPKTYPSPVEPGNLRSAQTSAIPARSNEVWRSWGMARLISPCSIAGYPVKSLASTATIPRYGGSGRLRE